MRPLDRAYGLCRSLWMYYARPGGAAALDHFYRPFVPTGGLCFDIGAHVGNRTRCWSRLGARVIAVEPQGDFARFLRWLFRADPRVTILELAVAERAGTIRMQVSPRTPTVSSGSERFVAAASRVPAFAWVRWDAIIDVPATTLDELIGAHGQPDFVKIDVEGMEHEVLAGLSQPVAVVFVRVRAFGTGECAGKRRPPGGAGRLPLQRFARRKSHAGVSGLGGD